MGPEVEDDVSAPSAHTPFFNFNLGQKYTFERMVSNMKGLIRRVYLVVWILCAVFVFGMGLTGSADTLPETQLPVLVTSAGQCPQAKVVSVFADIAELKHDYHQMPTIEMLKKGVGLGEDSGAKIGTNLEEYPLGTHYKTVFITMGASMKGMGAAGISADFENNRVEKVVAWFKKQGVFIIGVHIAGEDRRYHYLSEGMIDRVAPFCNLLLISHESNEDGRFTQISEEHDIPMVLVDTEFDLPPVISELFDLQIETPR